MKVSIIGLGATAKDFKPDGSISIGVNDVQGCDYQVCVDRPSAFTNERISNFKSIAIDYLSEVAQSYKIYDELDFVMPTFKMFTQINEWKELLRIEIEPIELKAIAAHGDRWGKFIPSSNNSPFVACGVAWKFFAATEIYLYGVDFQDHPNINGAMREQAVEDFKLLQKILNVRGCFIYPHQDSYLYGKI